MKNPKRFEIWLVNWNPGRGSEQEGLRPSLVIQTDAGNINPNYPNTIVLAISTKGRLELSLLSLSKLSFSPHLNYSTLPVTHYLIS